jgi:hypothetical protein
MVQAVLRNDFNPTRRLKPCLSPGLMRFPSVLTASNGGHTMATTITPCAVCLYTRPGGFKREVENIEESQL